METKPEYYQTRDTESIRFPKIRRGIIVVSFIILITWIVVVSFYAYQDPNILCFTDKRINILTYVMLGTSFIGLLVYIGSPDSQLKISSWIRRIPMFWDSLMDSGYTPYFNPDYFEIKNGHYVKVQSSAYKVDYVGLPIVTPLTPLNSFNMSIYNRYYKSVIESAKRWKDATSDQLEKVMRKYLIERAQIVLIGATCMIVKARSGEHLLIHNSKYNEFIQDQIKTTRRTDLDNKRAKELELQKKYIEGLQYFTKRLNNRFESPPAGYEKNSPLYEHYDLLFNEMIQLNECNNESIIPQLQVVLKELLDSPTIPQSLKYVHSKHTELSIANAIRKTVMANIVQTEILNKLDTSKKRNNTENVLAQIAKLVQTEYTSAIKMDDRLVTSKQILAQFSNDFNKLKETLNKKTIATCEFVTKIKILPKYDTRRILAPFIAASNAGYNNTHGVGYAINVIKDTSTSGRANFRNVVKTVLNSKNLPTADLLKNAISTKAYASAELAKCRSITKLMNDTMKIRTAEQQALHAALAINPSRLDVQASVNLTEAQIANIKSVEEAERIVSKQVSTILTEAEQIELTAKDTERNKYGLENGMLTDISEIDRRDHEGQKMAIQLDRFKIDLDRSIAEKLDLGERLSKLTDFIRDNSAQTEDIQRQQPQIELAHKEIEAITAVTSDKDRLIADIKFKMDEKDKENKANIESITALEISLQRKTAELTQVNDQHTADVSKLAELTSKLSNYVTGRQQMLDETAIMIESIKRDGDTKLKEVVAEKESELSGLRTDINETTKLLQKADQDKVAFDEQLRVKDAEITERQRELQRVTELAQKKEADAKKMIATNMVQSMFSTVISSISADKKAEKEKEDLLKQKRAEYAAINEKLIEANRSAAQLSHVLDENKARLEALESDRTVSTATIAALQQKSKQSDAEKQELEQQKLALEQIKQELERTRQANADREKTIEQLQSDKAAYEQTLANNTEHIHKNELAALAAIRDQETAVALRLQKITSEKREIEAMASRSQEEISQLQQEKDGLESELQKSERKYKKRLKEMQFNFNENLQTLTEVCASVAKKLNKYEQSGINIKIKHSNLPIKANSFIINLNLIKELNIQVTNYINANGLTSTYLMNKIIPTIYTSSSSKTPTLLNEDQGKLFAYVYSVYYIMATHDKINEAVANLQRCALQNPEQYQILNGCRSFIANGAKLFNDTNSVSYLINAINAQRITYLNKKIIEIKAAYSEQVAGKKIYNDVMDELYKFSFEKNDSIEIAPPAKTLTPRKPSQSAVTPSRQSNSKSQQAESYRSTPAAFSEPIPMTYEERRKREGVTEINYDTGAGEAILSIPSKSRFMQDDRDVPIEEVNLLLDDTEYAAPQSFSTPKQDRYR